MAATVTNGSPIAEGSPEQAQFVRKCPGKNKAECLQRHEHPNTRWECAFSTTSKDEYHKHLKNIIKRTKWKQEVQQWEKEPDPDGVYRCVYYSTDRHHVENHYHKGSSDPLTPSPQQIMRYKNYCVQTKQTGKEKSNGKRNHPDDVKDDEETDEETDIRDLKKLKQDASLLGFLSGEHPTGSSNNGDKELILQDTHKVEDLIEAIQKKLEIPHEMTVSSLEKLVKSGYTTVGNMKGLNNEGWEKLQLPLAIEEELKNSIFTPTTYPAFYGMVPFAWTPTPGFTHQAGYWTGQYANQTQSQPVYYNQIPYQTSYETHESVLSENDVATTATVIVEEKKDKLEVEKQVNIMNMVVSTLQNNTNEQEQPQTIVQSHIGTPHESGKE